MSNIVKINYEKYSSVRDFQNLSKLEGPIFKNQIIKTFGKKHTHLIFFKVITFKSCDKLVSTLKN